MFLFILFWFQPLDGFCSFFFFFLNPCDLFFFINLVCIELQNWAGPGLFVYLCLYRFMTVGVDGMEACIVVVILLLIIDQGELLFTMTTV